MNVVLIPDISQENSTYIIVCWQSYCIY